MFCLNCNKETQNPKFCGRSCSTAYNNKLNPRKKLEGICSCGKVISKTRKYCVDCRNTNSEEYRKMTLAEFQKRSSVKGKHPSWKNAHLRHFARRWHKERIIEPCQNCGYDKHVEVCHIKPVRDFLPTATLGEVNAKENVVFLCPNCHWEFDNGLLTLSEGLEPPSSKLCA
jgi:hypothetical protein